MAEVAVVGGGIVGALVFHELAARGVDVHLVERDRPGAGATGYAGGTVRCFDDDPVVARRNLLGWRRYRELCARPGFRGLFHAEGFLYFPAAHRVPAARRSAAELARTAPVTWLTPDLLGARFGRLLRDTAPGAVWEPAAGHVEPVPLVRALVAAGAAAGGAVSEGVEVTGVTDRAGQVTGLVTSAGRLPAGAVVVAAGTGSAPLLDRIGVPTAPAAKVIQVELCAATLPDGHPAYVDDVHDVNGLPGPAPGTVYLGHPTGRWDPGPDAGRLDPAQTAAALRAGGRRFAWVAGCRPRGGVRAVESFPDRTSGPGTSPVATVPGRPGLVLATGFGGGGIRLGPWAAAEVLRTLSTVALPPTQELCATR